jgi:hypothetical protein
MNRRSHNAAEAHNTAGGIVVFNDPSNCARRMWKFVLVYGFKQKHQKSVTAMKH